MSVNWRAFHHIQKDILEWNFFQFPSLHQLNNLVSRIPLLITAQLNWMVTVAVRVQLYHILQIAFWETYSRNLMRPLSNSSSLEAHWPLHHTLLQHHLAAPLAFVQNFEFRGGRAQSLVEAQLHLPTTPADHFDDKASMLLPIIFRLKPHLALSKNLSEWLAALPPHEIHHFVLVPTPFLTFHCFRQFFCSEQTICNNCDCFYPFRVTHMPSIASYSNNRNPLSYIRSSLPISNPHLNSYCVHLETIDLLNRSTIQNSALVVFGRNPSFNLAIEGFKKSFFTFQATGKYLGLGCGIGHVGIHWPRDTITSLRRAGGVWSMFWQPRVVDRSLRYLQYLHSLAFLSPYKWLS